MLEGVEFILWFDFIKEAKARFHKLTHGWFPDISMEPNSVIDIFLIQGWEK